MSAARVDDLVPPFIYGTAWKEEDTARLTKLALRCGFRAIDTANQRKHYLEAGVGEAVGEAIEAGWVERDELFIQTKFTYAAGQDHRLPYDEQAPFDRQVEQSLASSLDHLGIDVIDSYILHGPSTRVGLGEPDRQVWRAMESLMASGQVEAIGVSNISADQLKELIAMADRCPAFVQNRCFARARWDEKVRQICEANGVVYQGFSLLTANVRQLQRQPIRDIATRHGCTVAQLVFRFAIQIGMVPLTGTTSEEHMKEDLACVDVSLDGRERELIEGVAAI